ncbi:phage portal protein [Kitasatospora sp. MBT66]|uniref:phage portal protein n=1 Tax=Kitasatospora sp. MBT66 TaxID=1444769 RepID=UPI00068C49AE|nr:phage portal protein [Kitasatospora sp. MBT66]
MAIDATVVGSPGWWLARLGHRILAERKELDRLWKYAIGEPDLPSVPGVAPGAVGDWMNVARTNWSGLVLDAPAERLGVTGFRFGDKSADSEANKIWQANFMDADADLVHYGALSQRRAYVLVERDEDGQPALSHETPRQMAVEHQPGRPRKLAAGLKLWRDDWTGQTRATLWLPDGIHHFQTKDEQPVFLGLVGRHILGRWDAFSLPGDRGNSEANLLGQVPIVPFVNRRNRSLSGFAEHEDITSVQDRINLSVLNLIAAMRYGSFRQRWAAGLEVDEDPVTGKPVEPFKLDITKLWTTESPDTRFGEFQATDLGPYVQAVSAGVQDLAALSHTPPHYLMGVVANVSGDALKSAETGLVAKVKDRQRAFGESWEQVLRLAFRVLGDTERARVTGAETVWRDPESRTVAELADAAVKKAAAGVPWRQRMEDLGYTPQEISRMEVDRAQDAMLAPLATETSRPPAPAPAPAAAPGDPGVVGRAAA